MLFQKKIRTKRNMVMLPIMRYRQPHLWKKKRTIVNKQKKGRKKENYL